MKILFQLIVVVITLSLIACNNRSRGNVHKKKIIDSILRGEEVFLYELPKYGEEKGEQAGEYGGANHFSLRPYHCARELGYSEEDLEILKNLVVKLPTPKSAEKQP